MQYTIEFAIGIAFIRELKIILLEGFTTFHIENDAKVY